MCSVIGKDPANGVSMRVGSELKAARKRAGISVDVISKRTKINVSKLVALEKNDFKNLPTGLYLFSTVRAYAREVHIDPEPIVQRLRAEFADKDALDALHALDATGALDAKNLADARRSKEEQSNRLRNAAIAAGVVLMAAAGASAGAYLHNIRGIAHEVRGTKVERSSAAPVSLSSPAPATTVATALDVPQQAAGATHRPAPAKTHRPKPRTVAVMPGLQETVATVGAVSDALGSSGVMQQIEFPSPARIEEPSDRPANTEELRPEPPVLATAP
jgi:cytoskeleton protein RodZ